MSQTFFWPWSLLTMLAFGVAYAIQLRQAIHRGIYKITRIHFIDTLLVWWFALVIAISPLMFYVAFAFDEFEKTPDGLRRQHRLRRTAQAETLMLVLYGLAVLAFVPQKSMPG